VSLAKGQWARLVPFITTTQRKIMYFLHSCTFFCVVQSIYVYSRIIYKLNTLNCVLIHGFFPRIDSCQSTTEIVTPYWAANSSGKVRAIVNTKHFEQAIHQEVCSKTATSRCTGDCGCEQKYKWHRLLAYDPDNDCKGIFMDWFLFPSCCVCRCDP